MKTAHSIKALVLLVAGISCAAIALSAFGGKHAGSSNGEPTVVVTETRMASGEMVPTVTVTARKLSTTQKIVFAMRDRAGNGAKPAADRT